MRYLTIFRLEPTLTAPKRVLVEVANRVEPDAEGHSDCDGPNNDDCEVEKAPLEGPVIQSALEIDERGKDHTRSPQITLIHHFQRLHFRC